MIIFPVWFMKFIDTHVSCDTTRSGLHARSGLLTYRNLTENNKAGMSKCAVKILNVYYVYRVTWNTFRSCQYLLRSKHHNKIMLSLDLYAFLAVGQLRLWSVFIPKKMVQLRFFIGTTAVNNVAQLRLTFLYLKRVVRV